MEIQELHKLANNLINSYYQQTSKKIEKLNQDWAKLSESEQSQAIAYLNQLKIRQEKNLLTNQENIVLESRKYREFFELQKFHEQS